MKQTIGWIVENNTSEMAARPLLGKTCHAHVEQAIEDSGIPVVKDESAFSKPFDIVLLVRDDAPCLSAATLGALVEVVSHGNASIGVLMGQPVREPLAMALPREKWFSTAQAHALSVREIAKMLLGVRDLQSGSIAVHRAKAPDACFAVCDAESYAKAFRLLGDVFVQKHLQNGVILLDPSRTIIEADVRIGAGTVVYPGNTLEGNTVIGLNCTLYPNNRLQNATIGDGVTVENSVLLDCTIGNHTTVGPFAYLRPATEVGDHCRIGDFVEIKNSAIGDRTKVSHLTYVGDSDLGQDINLGCGVVFVNYDGKSKSRSHVEDHAFIGCNCNLIAPVHIGKNAYLAAGSTVVENVPDDALYVARSRGVIKEDWVKQRKEQGKL